MSVSAAVSQTAQTVTNKVKDVVQTVKTDISAEKISMPNTGEVASEVKKVGNAVFGELSQMKFEQSSLLNQVVVLPGIIANAVVLVLSTLLSFTVFSTAKWSIPTLYTLLRGHAITLDAPSFNVNMEAFFKSFAVTLAFVIAVYVSTYVMHQRTTKIETKIASIVASAGLSSAISAIIGLFAGGEVDLALLQASMSGLAPTSANAAVPARLLVYSANPFMIFVSDFVLFLIVAAVAVYASGEFKLSKLLDRVVKFSGALLGVAVVASVVAIGVGLPMGLTNAARKYGLPVESFNFWSVGLLFTSVELLPNVLGLGLGATSVVSVGRMDVVNMSLFGGVAPTTVSERLLQSVFGSYLPGVSGALDRFLKEVFSPVTLIAIVIVLLGAVAVAYYFDLTVKQLKSKYLSFLVNASMMAFVLTFVINLGHRVINIPHTLVTFLPREIKGALEAIFGVTSGASSREAVNVLDMSLGVNVGVTFIMITIVTYIVLLLVDVIAKQVALKNSK